MAHSPQQLRNLIRDHQISKHALSSDAQARSDTAARPNAVEMQL